MKKVGKAGLRNIPIANRDRHLGGIAVITLSEEGRALAKRLIAGLLGRACALYLPEALCSGDNVERPFKAGLFRITEQLFGSYEALLYLMPLGAAVRAIGPHLKDKRSDPAVVVVDVAGRYAISVAGGHERGANELAHEVANLLGCEAVITTSAEAKRQLIVGVGCRRGAASGAICDAIEKCLAELGESADNVRYVATADFKGRESGLIEAAKRLGLPLKLVPLADIRATFREYAKSDFVKRKVGIGGVCEPAALLSGRRTQLVLRKKVFPGVAIAVARESFS